MNKLALFLLLILTSCNLRDIRFTLVPTHFYLTNQKLIDPLLKVIHDNCRPKEEIQVTLRFDYMPQELININPQHSGLTSMYAELTMIEVNIYQFAYMSQKEQQVLIIHELGHMLGLEHSAKEHSVMYHENNAQADMAEFKQQVSTHCQSISDVPRRNEYLKK